MNSEVKYSADQLNVALSKSPYINELDLLSLRQKCFAAKPFRYICIDGMWNEDFLTKCSNEVSELEEWAGEKSFYSSKNKKWQADWDVLPPNTNSLLAYLNQPTVLKLIEFLTGEKGLIADPYLEGGGMRWTNSLSQSKSQLEKDQK